MSPTKSLHSRDLEIGFKQQDKHFWELLIFTCFCCHSNVAKTILSWWWERLPWVRLRTICGEMANGHQNLHSPLLPRHTARWHFLASFAITCGQVTELQLVELGKHDMCQFQAWPIKRSQGHSYMPFLLWPRKGSWPRSALEFTVWHGLGHFSMDLTLELGNVVPVNARPLPGFLGRSDERMRIIWSHSHSVEPSWWMTLYHQSNLACGLWTSFS